MENLFLSFYSVFPGVSEDLIQELYDLDASLLTIISAVSFFLALGLSGFFYFNPFDFKKTFWRPSHWGMILAASGILSLLFTISTCFQNEDELTSSGVTEFIGLGILTGLLTLILYVIFSFLFKTIGNPVTRYTPV